MNKCELRGHDTDNLSNLSDMFRTSLSFDYIENSTFLDRVPTNEEEWKNVCEIRWEDAPEIIAEDPFFQRFLMSLPDERRSHVYEHFYKWMEACEECFTPSKRIKTSEILEGKKHIDLPNILQIETTTILGCLSHWACIGLQFKGRPEFRLFRRRLDEPSQLPSTDQSDAGISVSPTGSPIKKDTIDAHHDSSDPALEEEMGLEQLSRMPSKWKPMDSVDLYKYMIPTTMSAQNENYSIDLYSFYHDTVLISMCYLQEQQLIYVDLNQEEPQSHYLPLTGSIQMISNLSKSKKHLYRVLNSCSHSSSYVACVYHVLRPDEYDRIMEQKKRSPNASTDRREQSERSPENEMLEYMKAIKFSCVCVWKIQWTTSSPEGATGSSTRSGIFDLQPLYVIKGKTSKKNEQTSGHISCITFNKDAPEKLCIGHYDGTLSLYTLEDDQYICDSRRFHPAPNIFQELSQGHPIGFLGNRSALDNPLSIDYRLTGERRRLCIGKVDSMTVNSCTGSRQSEMRRLGKNVAYTQRGTGSVVSISSWGNVIAYHRADNALLFGDVSTGSASAGFYHSNLLRNIPKPLWAYPSVRIFTSRICILWPNGVLFIVDAKFDIPQLNDTTITTPAATIIQ